MSRAFPDLLVENSIRPPEARRLLDEVERKLAPLDQEILRSEWQLLVGRSRTGPEPWQVRRSRLLGAPGLLERIRSIRSTNLPSRAARRAELLERVCLEARIEQADEVVRRRSRLQRRIARFRPLWRGRRVGRVVVRRAIRMDPDREARKTAYYAEDPLFRPMERELATLVRVRNERARALGFRSFPEYRLSLEGSSVARLRELIDETARFVPTVMKSVREQFEDRTGERGWLPWDLAYSDQLAGGLPDSAFPGKTMFVSVRAAVREWGFPARAFDFRVVRHDLPAGGMCLAPDPPRDVRVLVHPAGGWLQYLVLFHEVGHAVNSRSVRQPTHLLRWHEYVPGFGGIAEGVGRFFEQITMNEAWLRTRTDVDAATRSSALALFRRRPLQAVASLATWIEEELALYERPDRDPAEVGMRVHRRLFGFDSYQPQSFADSFAIGAPLYSPSYLFAGLLQPQLATAALAEVGGELWPNRRIGPWLDRHWFRDGSSYNWWERLREVTGRPLGAGPLNAELRDLIRSSE